MIPGSKKTFYSLFVYTCPKTTTTVVPFFLTNKKKTKILCLSWLKKILYFTSMCFVNGWMKKNGIYFDEISPVWNNRINLLHTNIYRLLIDIFFNVQFGSTWFRLVQTMRIHFFPKKQQNFPLQYIIQKNFW